MIRFDKTHPFFKENFLLSGAGSRTFNQFMDPMLLDICCLRVQKLQEAHPGRAFGLVSGGAQGWDRYLTKIAVKMQIPFVLVIPSPEYPDYYWGPRGSLDHRNHMEDWATMERRATEVLYVCSSFTGSNGRPGGANFDRNKTLVEIGNHFLVWDEHTGSGTTHAIRQLRIGHKPYTDILKEYNQCSPQRSA